MDYALHYNKLIHRAKNRHLDDSVHTESHHIIPTCMNGGNDSTNLVDLTPEEHFLAHQLLVKIYPNVPKLIYAAQLMCYDNAGHRVHNKLYGWIRKRMAAETSLRFKGKNTGLHPAVMCPYCNKEGGSHSMKRYHFENCTKHPNPAIQALNKIGRIGKPQSDKTKAKRKETQKDNPPHKGKLHSAETKAYMSKIKLQDDNPLRGIKAGPQPIVMCPHCNKEGGQNNMTKYHFDKCKHKNTDSTE